MSSVKQNISNRIFPVLKEKKENKRNMWHLPPVNIKSDALNTFFSLFNIFDKTNSVHWLTWKKRWISFVFKSQLIHTFTESTDSNCSNKNGMYIDNKVYINFKYLENKRVLGFTILNYQPERKIISTDHIFTLIRRGNKFIARSVELSFALQIELA